MVTDEPPADGVVGDREPEGPARRPWRRTHLAFRACSWLVALVVVGFFLIGLGDGTIAAFNAGIWFVLLAVTATSVWGGHALHAHGRPGLAILALAVTAVPGIIAALFVLLLLVLQPQWN